VARKKERGNGTGTVYPRKNKQGKVIGYRGSYFAPDGKRRYVSAKKKSDAERALRQAMTDAERGLVFEAGTVTVEEYLTLAQGFRAGHRAPLDLRPVRERSQSPHRPRVGTPQAQGFDAGARARPLP
jgi:hypothetical protein